MSNCGPTVYRTIHSLADAEAWKGIKYKDLIAILSGRMQEKQRLLVGALNANFTCFLLRIWRYASTGNF